jgi:hypothetical protein
VGSNPTLSAYLVCNLMKIKKKYKYGQQQPNSLPHIKNTSWYQTLESELQRVDRKQLTGECICSDLQRLLELEQRVVAERLEAAMRRVAKMRAIQKPRRRGFRSIKMELQIEAFCRKHPMKSARWISDQLCIKGINISGRTIYRIRERLKK